MKMKVMGSLMLFSLCTRLRKHLVNLIYLFSLRAYNNNNDNNEARAKPYRL